MSEDNSRARLLRVGRHDRLQLELKLEQPTPSLDATAVDYEVDLFFWLPQATSVSASEYPPELFYEDLRVYTRLKTPDVPLDQIVRPDGAGSPLFVLETVLERADDDGPLAGDVAMVCSEPKLLCAMLKSRVRDLFAELDPKDLDGAAPRLAAEMECLVTAWRSAKDRLLAFEDLDPLARDSLNYCDEAVSIQVELAVLQMLGLMRQHERSPAGVAARLSTLASDERRYRHAAGWRTVLRPDGTERQDEAVLDQGRLLKKYWSSVLHLSPRRDRWDSLARHGALGVAAGLAMLWAVAVQVWMLIALGLQVQKGVSLGFIAVFSGLAVGAYVLKDRIKAWTSAWLARRLPRWFDDRRFHLHPDGGETSLAKTAERVQFVSPDAVPEAVLEARLASLRNRLLLEARQDVLHYRRRVQQNPRRGVAGFTRYDGLTDVLRLNLWRWVRGYARSRRRLELLDEDGDLLTRRVDNRYFVDLIARYRRVSPEPFEVYSHHVLVLNRHGIVRVEAAEERFELP